MKALILSVTLALAGAASLQAACLPALAAPAPSLSSDDARHRVIILSDIENEPDDSESMVRLLLYSNQLDIEALIATTSVHMKTRVAPETMQAIIAAYGKVQPNLLKHEKGFPDAKTLSARVTQGLPVYGMAGVGDGKDSAGSARIIALLDNPDPRPIYVSVWGGANVLAQALYKIKQTRSPAETARLIAKLRVYTISDQDDTGIWMRKTFPDLFYIVSPGGYGNATWSGIMWVEPGQDNSEISNAWLAEHIQQGHGPLGALYPDVAYGMEGDTPSFLSLIPNGLNAPEHPDWGGWGGRYRLYTPDRANTDLTGFNGGMPIEQEPRPIWTNAVDDYTPTLANPFGRTTKASEKTATGYRITVWRWRKEFQNDFAARMDWTTKPYAEANHPPVARLGHADHLTVKSGERFALSAKGSSDPDGDSLSYQWFHYPEIGDWKTPIPIASADNIYAVWVVAPKVTEPKTAHFILKVTDKGTPPLTRYKRVIVTITP
ncbi:DUF1593 domain-containing protein [Asticcacaulis sp. 201]|uniref:DUF1593 domain-containing protein n=1 Tax=Asticcacaulis sp. 201 TaxID=3028787 RepID=UPI00291700F2|nr:nucleoside hydrolase-like domain-containing protein [Asticcacaulis sp. 201]MDV6329997.1 DUF1593 domain-containing protein [Asticcacaulis sp. 201]